MTRDRWQKDPTAVREAERFFKFVCQYVISFQWLEGKIDDIFLLARGHNNRKQTFAWLAQQTNEKKSTPFATLSSMGHISLPSWSMDGKRVFIALLIAFTRNAVAETGYCTHSSYSIFWR